MTRQEQLEAIRCKANQKANGQKPAAPPPRGHSENKHDQLVAYFDSNHSNFWRPNSRGDFIQFTEASIRRVLKYSVYHETTDKEAQYTMIDRHLMKMQHEDDVAYAGPIAGYYPGVHEICGVRFLVTSGPHMYASKESDWSLLKSFIEGMLKDQSRVFYAWMKSALRAFYSGAPFRPGQMLAIAGPAGCGKSLLQNLVTEMLGGRVAKPFRYMTGESTFNSDLIGCEHLMIEDEAASTDVRIRRQFGSMLKNMVVNEVQSLHRKGRDALSVSPFWRITITLNDEPENLVVLPPIDESLRDKITLLRANLPTFPYAADDMGMRRQFRMKLSEQIPGFLASLKIWRIPPAWVNQRYGVTAFQDPELLRELEDLSPEIKLLTLIDTLQIWGIDRVPFVGTSSQLEEVLLEKDKLGRVQKLLGFNTACGTYLGRLKNRFPDRFSESRHMTKGRIWQIKPPPT